MRRLLTKPGLGSSPPGLPDYVAEKRSSCSALLGCRERTDRDVVSVRISQRELRRRLRLAEERLVPFEAARNVTYADDCPRPFHRISAGGLTRTS
jgi:hypothetical protein